MAKSPDLSNLRSWFQFLTGPAVQGISRGSITPLSSAEACGFLGCMVVELGQPYLERLDVLEKGSGAGRGAMQYTGVRRTAYDKARAATIAGGHDPDSNAWQQEYFAEEYAGMHDPPEGSLIGWTRVFQDRPAGMDPAQAAAYWMTHYFRPAVPHLERRQAAAKQIWNYHRAGKLTTPATAAPAAPARPAPASPAAPEKVLLTIEALQNTWLKKSQDQAELLPENRRHAVHRGKRYGVVEWRELPETAHVEVVLAAGAGTWIIWEPHFRKRTSFGEALQREIDWADFSCLVTPHLTVGEVLRWDARRRPRSDADKKRIIQTAAQFEKMRGSWGRPIGVTSFYRPEPINQQVGGVPGSFHVTGEAMDIYSLGISINTLYTWIMQRWTGGIGDGRDRGFIHLDTRDGGGFVPGAGARPSTWWDY